jgi:hypothetical protein
VSVSFIGILRSVRDGQSCRHHRSPALAIKPAGQDSRNEARPPRRASHTTALLAPKCQSFLDNLIAGFSQNGSCNDVSALRAAVTLPRRGKNAKLGLNLAGADPCRKTARTNLNFRIDTDS